MQEEVTTEKEKPEAAAADSAEIRDTDIVFDCPYCGKSLVIDYRGLRIWISTRARFSSSFSRRGGTSRRPNLKSSL